MSPSDAELHDLLAAARTIAVVGHSDKPYRDSHNVAQYLRQAGYVVYAINPNLRSVAGDIAYPDLRHLPERIDIVNVFRRSEHLPQMIAATPKRIRHSPVGRAMRPPPSAIELEDLIRRCEGNMLRVARELDRKPALVYRWAKRYKINVDSFRKKDL